MKALSRLGVTFSWEQRLMINRILNIPPPKPLVKMPEKLIKAIAKAHVCLYKNKGE